MKLNNQISQVDNSVHFQELATWGTLTINSITQWINLFRQRDSDFEEFPSTNKSKKGAEVGDSFRIRESPKDNKNKKLKDHGAIAYPFHHQKQQYVGSLSNSKIS